jgi:hypothetical protein
MKLSKTLSPLEPLKEKINVIDDLDVHALTGQGIRPARDLAVSYPARTYRKAPSSAAEKLGFVSGHDFSRAVKSGQRRGL